jgi:hypothetical protein
LLVDAQEARKLSQICEKQLLNVIALHGALTLRGSLFQGISANVSLVASTHKNCALGHEENGKKPLAQFFFGLFHATTHALCRCGFKPGLVPVHSPYRTMVQLNVVYRWIEIPTAESEKILLTFCKNKIWKLSHRTS